MANSNPFDTLPHPDDTPGIAAKKARLRHAKGKKKKGGKNAAALKQFLQRMAAAKQMQQPPMAAQPMMGGMPSE